MKTLNKAAIFGDLHVGAKNGSIQYNEDCLEYITWFCNNVKNDSTIDHIVDVGDFFDDRAKLSTFTLDYGYRISKMIDDLNLPFYRLLGNHSLGQRNNRDVHNMISFSTMKNTTLIEEITIMKHFGKKGAVLAPYLFKDEYPEMLKYVEYPYAYMHAEFNGFVITGDSILCENGVDHSTYKQFKRIITGHFHRRDEKDNVTYIGNTFPTNFADANDSKRGMATLEYDTNKITFIDWSECPTYIRTKLSKILESPKDILKSKATVQCLVDIDLTHEESIELKSNLIKKYNLRELTLDEGFNMNKNLDGDTEVDDELVLESLDTIIKEKLKTVSVEKIKTDTLIKLYDDLKL